jgi:GxxExxY protein
MNENGLSNVVINRALRVHSALGPGLLESAYSACLFFELRHAGLRVEVEKPLPLIYKEVKLDCGYRVDLLLEGKLVIESKVS